MSEYIIFLLGALSGGCLVAFVSAIIHTRIMQEAHDKFCSIRETIRRYAYARGYEDAKKGGLKRS